MTDPTLISHQTGLRVRSVFDDGREGVVIESNPRATLIEFEDVEGGKRYTHRKWLPTRHWAVIP